MVVVAIVAGGAAGYVIWVTSQPTCSVAPKGSVLYIRLASADGNTPVTDATIDATPVEACDGVNTTIAILWQPPINASGVAMLNASGVTFYSVTIYSGSYRLNSSVMNYQFTADVRNSLTTCADVIISPTAWSHAVSPC